MEGIFMKKKKWLVIIMAGLLMLSGCGSVTDQPVKSIKIGISVYDQYDTFVAQMMSAFNSYATK